jgi:pimeloyl-ACP methyl ester carboxylesterase
MNPSAVQHLVLVPGLMCNAQVWEPVLPFVPPQLSITIADHGQAADLTVMAEQVLAAAPVRFAIAGHSMGGRVAMEVVRLAPERVSHLALIDTAYLPRAAGAAGETERARRYVLRDLAYTQGVDVMARTWVQDMVHPDRLHDQDLIEAIVAMFATKTADIFAGQIEALLKRPDATPVLRSLRIPTLLALGRQDNWANLAQHEAMHQLAPGSVLDVIEEAGHMAPMERPQAMGESLTRWLTRQV